MRAFSIRRPYRLMPHTRTHKPAEVFPPGEFIREELEVIQGTQADLAAVVRPLRTRLERDAHWQNKLRWLD